MLLARGHDPDTLLTMRHSGSEHDSFVPRSITELAKWTVKERDKTGLRMETWQPPTEWAEKVTGGDRESPLADSEGETYPNEAA